MPRKSTGKKLRFDVFKRDGFACRYCGAQPPDVVLVVDHIVPVVDGGDSTIDNLNTACEPCNQGKGGRSLAAVQPRPDADMLYLEAMQEAAELARYREALAEKEAQLNGLCVELQEVWAVISGLEWVPAEHILRQMLSRYEPEVLEYGVRDVAAKVGGGYVERNRWVPYLWAVLRNADEERAV